MRTLFVLFLSLLLSPLAMAQGSFFQKQANREGTWEMGVRIVNQGSESVEGQEDTGISLSSTTGAAFVIGYNLSDHLTFSGDFTWTRPRYDARFQVEDGDTGELVPVTVNTKADFFNMQARGTWNIMEGAFTPFLEGAIGLMYTDSNVADGPPTTGCWWDPWWGYVCRNFWSTYNDWNWTYTLGAGLRYDVNRDFTLRGAFSRRYIDFSSSSDPELDLISVDLLWRF